MTKNLRLSFLRNRVFAIAIPLLTLLCIGTTGSAQSGHSLNYDGVDDEAITATDVVGTGSYTKEAWVRFSSLVAGHAYNILSQDNNGSTFVVYNNQLQAAQNPGYPYVATDPVALTTNVWYHVAVTYDAATQIMTIYKNGVSVATATSVPNNGSGGALFIGNWNGGGAAYGMLGDLDEVRVWDYARSATEISSNYQCTVPVNSPGLTLYYDFEQGIANGTNTGITTITDRTTNGNDATLYNFALTGTTSNFTDATPSLSGECSVVPVRFASFDAKVSNGGVSLHWQTATEINNAGFDVERSANGSTGWQSIGFVAGKGNSVSLNDYNFTDESPASGTNYYRLNQKDLDGNSLYSKVVSVSITSSGVAKLYPTMAVSKITLSVPDRSLLQTRFLIFDNNGKRVSEGTIKSTEQTIDVSNLNKGIYFLKIQNGSAFKFLKQ